MTKEEKQILKKAGKILAFELATHGQVGIAGFGRFTASERGTLYSDGVQGQEKIFERTRVRGRVSFRPWKALTDLFPMRPKCERAKHQVCYHRDGDGHTGQCINALGWHFIP